MLRRIPYIALLTVTGLMMGWMVNAPAQPPAAGQAGKPMGNDSEQLLEQLNLRNNEIQQMQGENLKNIYQQNKQGVQLKEAF